MTSPITFEPIHIKQALNQVNAPSMPFAWSLNPYRGCQHGCSFCYARSTHAFLGLEADDTFQKHIFIKENVAIALEQQLVKLLRSREGLHKLGKVAIGTATDPYQPVEAKEQLTRRSLELFARYRIPVTITTRSPLVLRDMDLLKAIPEVTVNLSISTLNTTIWRDFEPFTPSPGKRLETLRTLKENGVNAGIFMAPVLPLITDTDEELERLIREAAACHPDFIMTSYLRLNTREVKVWFFQTIRERYPHLLSRYAALYQGSPGLPASYKNERYPYIQKLLQAYCIPAHDPLSPRTASKPEPSPVQISFSF